MLSTKEEEALPSSSKLAAVIPNLVPPIWIAALPSGRLPWETARELQLAPNPKKAGKRSGMNCPDQLFIAQAP